MIDTKATSARRLPLRSASARAGLTAACFLALAGFAQAQVVKPSASIGDATQVPSNSGNGGGINAPGGAAFQYLITTESTSGDGSNISGTSAVPVGQLANALYVSSSSVAYDANDPGTEGSALTFTLNLTAARNTVVFTSAFATSEDVGGTANPDFALYTLTPVDGNGLATGPSLTGLIGSAGDAIGNFTTVTSATNPFNLTEGYKSFSLGGNLTPGTYVLGLGVADANTTDTQSGLYIGSVTLVPEPGVSTIVLIAGGAGALWFSRRRKSVQA